MDDEEQDSETAKQFDRNSSKEQLFLEDLEIEEGQDQSTNPSMSKSDSPPVHNGDEHSLMVLGGKSDGDSYNFRRHSLPAKMSDLQVIPSPCSERKKTCNWISSNSDIRDSMSNEYQLSKTSDCLEINSDKIKEFIICKSCLSNRRNEFTYDEVIHDSDYNGMVEMNSLKKICICSGKTKVKPWTNQKTHEKCASFTTEMQRNKNRTFNIDMLPSEIMLKIFSYFTPTELCRYVAPVCLTWLQYARDSSLWEVITQEEFKSVPSDLLVNVITSWCALLRSVDFRCRIDMTIFDFELIFRSCPLIETISFAFCTQVDDDFVKLCAHYCHHLKYINTEGCPISDASIILLFGKPIHGFNASHCTMISDDGLTFLAQNFKNLMKINFDGIQWISQASVEILVELHAESLTEVFLDGAELLDDSVRLLSRCKHLRKFSFSFCDTLTDDSLVWIEQFKRLEYLQLKKGANFSNAGMLKLLSSFKHLEGKGLTYLNLAECTALSDECLHAMSESCPNLRILNLSWCWEVTDDGINFIFDSCHKITELHLCGLHELYGIPFRRTQHEMPNLQYLDLRQCNKTSDDMLVDLSSTIKNLTVLNYYGDRLNADLNFWNMESKCSPGHFHHTAF